MVYGANLGVEPTNNDYIVVLKKYSDKGKQFVIPADKKDSFYKQKLGQEFNENIQKAITVIAAFNIGTIVSCLTKGTAIRKNAIGLATASALWFVGHQVDKYTLKRTENKAFKSFGAQEISNQA